jgi:hypothetical protein
MWKIRSGTSPLVRAEMIFWFSAMNGMMLRSILLPLDFSNAATVARKAASSSGTKPWSRQTTAVPPAALVVLGRARIPVAARHRDPRIADRRRMLSMAVLLICLLTGCFGAGSILWLAPTPLLLSFDCRGVA